MSVHIYPIKTGLVKIKSSQRIRKSGGLIRVLFDKNWTEWLPIYAWVIEHPEGIFIVDTGETSRSASDPDYFPNWHPYYRSSVKADVKPEDEIGPQLKKLGINQSDIQKVILTHLHTDHAGGLHHFTGNEILVSHRDYILAKGFIGKLNGYLPNRWPKEFNPFPVMFNHESLGSFKQSYRLTKKGDIFIVPTPGHTPNHISVIVKENDLYYFLAGDTTYSQNNLIHNIPDGISLRASVTLNTMGKIRNFAKEFPTVYLPSHDPETAERLKHSELLDVNDNEEAELMKQSA
jgi:N-acyl homoserine lactone hydrolase